MIIHGTKDAPDWRRDTVMSTGAMKIMQLRSHWLVATVLALSSCAEKTTSTDGSAGSGKADDALAAEKKELEAPFAVIASYRELIDAPADSHRLIEPVGALAAWEVSRATASPGSSKVSDALKTVSKACGKDVSKLSMKENAGEIMAARKACSNGLMTLETSLASVGTSLPKVPKGSADESAKTALGKLIHGGSALKAYRDAMAKETTTIETLEPLGEPASTEMQQAASAVQQSSAEGSLSRAVAEAAPVVVQIFTGQTEAVGGYCSALKDYNSNGPDPKSKADSARLCAKMEMPKPAPAFLKSCAELMSKVCTP